MDKLMSKFFVDRLDRCFTAVLSPNMEKYVSALLRPAATGNNIVQPSAGGGGASAEGGESADSADGAAAAGEDERVDNSAPATDARGADASRNHAATIAQLRRAGISSMDHAEFDSPAAANFYYNHLFPGRASQRPKSLLALVQKAVGYISASRLSDGYDADFPKEATYQHLFSEALAKCLPAANTFVAEKRIHGTRNSLDFFINGDVKWALELLLRGHNNVDYEHVSRFDEQDGNKYAVLKPDEWLVAACRDVSEADHSDCDEQVCVLIFDVQERTCAFWSKLPGEDAQEQVIQMQP